MGVIGVGVTVIVIRQGVCVGGTVLVGPPGVFVTVGMPGVGVGQGMTHPETGQGVDVCVGSPVGVWVGVTVNTSRQGVISGVLVGPGGTSVGQSKMQPVVGHGVGDPANGVGVALTMQGVAVTVLVTVGPPGVTVTVGVPGVGVGHFWNMKSSADAERASASKPTTSSAADASTARIARWSASPFIPLPPQASSRNAVPSERVLVRTK